MEITPVSRLSSVIASVVENPEEVAEKLLKEFGTANALLEASETRLRQAAPPIVVHHISTMKAWMRDALHTEMYSGAVISTNQAVREYLQFEMSPLRVEQFRVLYLAKDMHLIADDLTAVGNEWSVDPSISEIARRAIDLNSFYIIVAHNHPNGRSVPSQNDIQFTQRLQETGRVLGFKVFDHVVVAKDKVISMRDMKLL